MIFFGGKLPDGMSRDEAARLGNRHLRQVVKICAAAGCKAVIEAHDEWARSEDILRLVGDLHPDEVGVLWDLEHPWRQGEKPLETAQRLGKYTQHIHIKDTRLVDGKHRQQLLGQGELPLPEMLAALKTTGYDGWICLEAEKRWDPESAEPTVSIPHFARYMKEHW